MNKIELASRLEAMARGEGAVQIADILDAAAALRESEEWRRDAERYRWLRDNENVSLYLTRNDHASVYKTAMQAMEDAASCGDDSFDDNTPEEVQKMKDDNTIWSLQIYPNTPVGFNVWNRATLDAAIDAARKEGV